ncbi:MAG: tetratricopeptide repeat protein [Pseudomonadota bacterium]
MDINDYIKKIKSCYNEKNYSLAYSIIENALAAYPLNLFFQKNEIYVLLKLGKMKEAIIKAEMKFELLKQDSFYLQNYLLLLEKVKATGDIESLLERHVLTENNWDKTFINFLVNFLERIFPEDRKTELLKRITGNLFDFTNEKAFNTEVKNEEPPKRKYRYYADIYNGKEIDKVLEEIESLRLIPKYREDADLLQYLAGLYKKQEDFEKAIEIYEKLLLLRDDLFTRKMLGFTYYKMGDYKSSFKYLKNVFFEAPFDNYLVQTIFNIFHKTFGYAEYVEYINEVIAKNPQAKYLYGYIKRAKKWEKQ